jgi:hypothetical protein
MLAAAGTAEAAPVATLDAEGRLRVVEGERTVLAEAGAARLAFHSCGR